MNGTKTQYYLNGSTILTQITGDDRFDFFYDENGLLLGFSYNGAKYYYIRNLQSDIIGILDNSGNQVVSYTYDSWGKLLSIDGSAKDTIGVQNPFRYRGYYYDTETELYYLNSRYYDPMVGRFLNADEVIADVNNTTKGYNMYIYCFSDPVNMSDMSGNWPKLIEDGLNWFNQNITQPITRFVQGITEDFKNYDPNNRSEDKVFSSNYFSNYKGTLVIKTPFDSSFSFGFIGLSQNQQTSTTLNHEYGHTIQMSNMGIIDYTAKVAIPSITINILDRIDKLPYDYYGAPWEAAADQLGGVNRTYNNTPWPEGAYNSYFDLVRMFWS